MAASEGVCFGAEAAPQALFQEGYIGGRVTVGGGGGALDRDSSTIHVAINAGIVRTDIG